MSDDRRPRGKSDRDNPVERKLRGYEQETLRTILTSALQAVDTGAIEHVPKLASDGGAAAHDDQTLKLAISALNQQFVGRFVILDERLDSLEQERSNIDGRVTAIVERHVDRHAQRLSPELLAAVGAVTVALVVLGNVTCGRLDDHARALRDSRAAIERISGPLDKLAADSARGAKVESVTSRLEQRITAVDHDLQARVGALESSPALLSWYSVPIGRSGDQVCAEHQRTCFGIAPYRTWNDSDLTLAYIECKTARRKSTSTCNGSEVAATFRIAGSDGTMRPAIDRHGDPRWSAQCLTTDPDDLRVYCVDWPDISRLARPGTDAPTARPE